MINTIVKNKARVLRSEGKTYPEIQKILKRNIPKSTLSCWCKDVKLPSFYEHKIKKLNKKNLNRARAMALIVNQKNWEKRLDLLLDRNIHLVDQINKSIQKTLLAILYLAEGAKHKSTRVLLLGSSKPKIIKFYLSLLNNCYQVVPNKFRVRIQCRYDQDTNKLEKYWQKVTKIKPEQFYPTYKDKRTRGKRTRDSNYKGVCVIHYFDTEIQLELELLANAIMDHVIKGR